MRKGQKGPVHTTLKEFENEGSSVNASIAYIHTQQLLFLDLCLRKNLGREITWCRRFPKPPFSKARPAFSNSSGLNGVLEKFLTVEIKMDFQISPT